MRRSCLRAQTSNPRGSDILDLLHRYHNDKVRKVIVIVISLACALKCHQCYTGRCRQKSSYSVVSGFLCSYLILLLVGSRQ